MILPTTHFFWIAMGALIYSKKKNTDTRKYCIASKYVYNLSACIAFTFALMQWSDLQAKRRQIKISSEGGLVVKNRLNSCENAFHWKKQDHFSAETCIFSMFLRTFAAFVPLRIRLYLRCGCFWAPSLLHSSFLLWRL